MPFRDKLPFKTPAPNAPPTTSHNLGADHLNAISEAVDAFNKMRGGTNSSTVLNGLGSGGGPHIRWTQDIVQVIDYWYDENGERIPDIYEVVFRVWAPEADTVTSPPDPDYGRWFGPQPPYNPDRVKEQLDARDLDVSFEIGDKLVAYLDENRQAWIPIVKAATKSPCNPFFEADSIEPSLFFTSVTFQDPGVIGHPIVAQLEISYDGGSTWLIAQSRRFRAYPDLTGSYQSTSEIAGATSVNGFTTFFANNTTLVRVTVAKGQSLAGTAILRAASIRMFALCQGGSGHFHTGADSRYTPGTNWKPTVSTGNVVDNLENGLPLLGVWNSNALFVQTPLTDPKNPNSGYEWWAVGVDFSATIAPTAIGCNSLIETQVENIPEFAINEATFEVGNHIIFQLQQNGDVINNKIYRANLVEDARTSGTGFVTFSAKNGDVITLTVCRGIGSLESELEEGSIRLEAKCKTELTDDRNVTSDSQCKKVTNMSTTATINNFAGNPWWPSFVNNGDSITISTPDADRWIIEAEFSVGENAGILSSGSSASSGSSSSQSSINSSSSSASSINSSSSSASSASSSSSIVTSDASVSSASSDSPLAPG